ncbi:hypothetical protein GUJ93_ZPchr0008g13824 [Zizania palustris]|uniref:NAC domain-containing protein n=1 Tax=Zizania palustris TaxID=103762 RepID=A0A8J5VG77_ZIZPA|nr:hypothetical protein GUJ93_ZPchr0008g13824 [Zizania palustris]
MTVMELKALPLGFRFHPTDEELIRHYLKGKITGTIRAEAEVIPEIDVCKCEPWDLPDKSLICSDDPEWFFFAPKDRKYPNGSRSNRATEAGYWKATGKDRVIRSKGDKKQQHMIGMKKTLVFHRGRAPKGERTGWIMHEYRTTEPEFESGEQGGYVLYRLFRKQEEKSERPSPDEMDRSGYSPTPSRSTPNNMVPNEDTDTPLNKESPESSLHENPIDLPGPTIESQPAPITRWLADRTDNMAKNDANISHMPLHGLVDEGAKASLSVGALVHLIDSQRNIHDTDELAPVSAPVLPHEENALFGNFWHGVIGNFDGCMNPPDLDEHSSTTPKVQYDSHTGILPAEFENIVMTQGEFIDDQNWLENFNLLPDEINPQLNVYENASLLPYDSTDQDVLSIDSGGDSLQDLFNIMDDSNVKNDGWINEAALLGTGFSSTHCQSQPNVHPNYIFSHQGNAQRRLRLQESLLANIELDDESMPRDECEDEESGIVTSKYANEAIEESSSEKDMPCDGDEAESTGITIQRRRHAPAASYVGDAESTGITIQSRHHAPTANYGGDAESMGITIQRCHHAPTASYGDDAESTGITIQSRSHTSTASTNSSFTEQGAAVRWLRLQVDLNPEPCSSIDGSSSCILEESESKHNMVKTEVSSITLKPMQSYFMEIG